MLLALRLTISGEITISSILEYFKDEKCLIASEHEDTNHHVHISLETDQSVDGTRNKMNRHFKPAKNMSYCKLDKGKYHIYTVKEGKIIYNNLWSEDQLLALQEESYCKPTRNKTKTELAMESFEPTKGTAYDEQGLCNTTYPYFDDECLIHWVRNYKGPFGFKHCQEYTLGCMAIHQPERLVKLLKKKIIFD